MSEPRKIEVVYCSGCWRAEIIPEYIGWFEAPTIAEFIEAVTEVFPSEELVFVVNSSSMDGNLDAELQFLEASEKSGATVISSVQEF